jgi:hypothetical protein
MSHSVPSDSSAIDATFLVGVDLVEFDRRELPIYASPQTRWMDACYDEAPSYGAPVDRVFGEPGDIHIDSVPGNDEQVASAIVTDDPLVALGTLADGLAVTGAEAAAPELATSFDFGVDAQDVIHLHDGAGWDITGADGTFDYLA